MINLQELYKPKTDKKAFERSKSPRIAKNDFTVFKSKQNEIKKNNEQINKIIRNNNFVLKQTITNFALRNLSPDDED